MRMLVDGHWLEAADGRFGAVVTNHRTAIRIDNLPSGGTKTSGKAREGQHKTLLDIAEQTTLLISRVLAA
jgi:acyl-CoA reductase-like NAD-dependent aldehyde dehydrogenase